MPDRCLERGPETLQSLSTLARRQGSESQRKLKVALLADSSVQWLVLGLKGCAQQLGFELQILTTPLYQISATIYDESSALYTEEPDYIVVFESSRSLLERFRLLSMADRAEFAQRQLDETRALAQRLRGRLKARILWLDVEELSDGVFGSLSSLHTHAFDYQIKQYSASLWTLPQGIQGFTIVPLSKLMARLGLRAASDARLFCLTNATVGLEFVPHLAFMILRIISTLEGRLCKALVLDLDNTLWGGVVGDIGVENVEIGDVGQGRAYQGVQEWALELKKRGILLAVSSKNNDEAARSPFMNRNEMILRLDDFACFEANWGTKVESIQRIREALNIGYDSIVFVDDNPVERDLVRQFLPEVVVPEMPDDPAEFVDFLTSLDLFGSAHATTEDAQRTSMIQAEQARIEQQSRFESLDQYLASLQMKATLGPVTTMTSKRAVQLLAKSNQFNLRTRRYSEMEIEERLSSSDYRCRCCTLSDRFGDHGLISVIILRLDVDSAFIENWVMSCRVFNRGVEHLMINHCAEMCREAGLRAIYGEYLPTAKNQVVSDLYPRLGFEDENGAWRLDVDKWKAVPHSINSKGANDDQIKR